jgi:hypothetical protein
VAGTEEQEHVAVDLDRGHDAALAAEVGETGGEDGTGGERGA